MPTTTTTHAVPPHIDARGWRPVAPELPFDDPRFMVAAAVAVGQMPQPVHEALAAFADQGHRSGALRLRDVDLGNIPPTPPTPTTATTKDMTSEFALLTIARRLGQPVGYEPEHGGRIVQNIVPTKDSADRQVSTSSAVSLMFHTETAFHPHRPRYLLLACLRGDASAATTLASVHEIAAALPADVLTTLAEARFRTAVDASFLGGRDNVLGPPRPILTGTPDEPTFVFDADLMVGTDAEADDAVRVVNDTIERCHTSVVLEAGDVLVVDNNVAVHGRTPYSPRFDGTDRWLQRTFVVSDLAPSAADRRGRMITTRFGV